jgi:aspartoacylase
MVKINSVAIVGGTHGNELTGVFLAQKFQRNLELVSRPSFNTQVLLGNPLAIEQCRRYIDKDLNRCFKPNDLENAALTSYEEQRAKQIQQILRPSNQLGVDVIIDLHSTTSNMGISILLSHKNHFLLNLAQYLSSVSDDVRVCYSSSSQSDSYLDSLSDLGFAIEVGPVAQGVLNAELFQKTERLVNAALDYIEAYNSRQIVNTSNKITIYQFISAIDYPKNAHGEIQGMIHPNLQFKDYEPLNKGDLIFLTFAGEEITYEGEFTVYPIFINEAAYYEKGVAMCFTEKQEIVLIE